jgi:UDP-N-acetylglucosamine 1-carboxyvinyltransferase
LRTGVFPPNLFKNIRASVFMLGAVLHRLKRVEAIYPGGCNIGERPIDIHLDGLEKFGAKVKRYSDGFTCECDKLKGANIQMPFPSVGATENFLITASVAEGRTVIKNSAREPEVVDLAYFLNKCGAKINGAGNSEIVIDGVKKLKGTTYKVVSDRIEAGTYLLATVLLGGEAEINCCKMQNIFPIINKTENSACKIYSFNDKIYIKAKGYPKAVAKTVAMPFPGFPTDLQPQLVAMLSCAEGVSRIYDNVFPNRFAYVNQMLKLGANIQVQGNCAIVNGVRNLVGCEVEAEDLRGGAGLILACLKANGKSVISGANHVDRGYDKIENKLKGLGLDINRAF